MLTQLLSHWIATLEITICFPCTCNPFPTKFPRATAIKPTGIASVDGVVSCKSIKVDAAFVADGIAGDEAAHVGVVEAVAEQVVVGVVFGVAELPAESNRARAAGLVVGEVISLVFLLANQLNL